MDTHLARGPARAPPRKPCMSLEPGTDFGLTRLDHVPPRACGMVGFLSAPDDEVVRLKAMGVCVGRRIEVIQTGDPLIIRAFGSRIGVSLRVAKHVFLDLCGHAYSLETAQASDRAVLTGALPGRDAQD